ncbi:DUF4267 domain-containing protein [Kibdelosporangium lantanae]|uniref:DUF4267 domain-containing protein n=1 Tax=Kibdelosporangium lantanae TaxID=1497396 RepID=A0ABW3MIF3_9PSEU
MHYAAITITILTGLGIIWVGLQYLLAPVKTATGFGLPAWPTESPSIAWLNIKGVRDVVSGLVVLIPLALGQYEVLGYLLLAASLTAFGDALTILRYRGKKAVAYGVHGTTAVLVLLAGVLFLTA